MKKRQAFYNGALLLLLVAVLCGGCSSSDILGDSQAFDTPAQVLANEGEALYRDGDYNEAAELFQQLKDRYPYSRFALLADLRVGDAYYKAGRHEEAVLAYDDFVRLHPKNEAVPYALFQMGMVWHGQMLTLDRDPTFARKATDTFRRLLKQYPKSEWAAKAKPRLQEAVLRQAGHDMFVGRFYYRKSKYKAAIGRFKRVLTQYPDVGLYGEAMEYIKMSQQALALEPAPKEGETDHERRDLQDLLRDQYDDQPPIVDDRLETLDKDRGTN